jgi:hypothetical protein
MLDRVDSKHARTDLRSLPYGAYLRPDGAVLFDRRYRPLVHCLGDGLAVVESHTRDGECCLLHLGTDSVVPVDPDARIPHVYQVWFYRDATSPQRDRATRERLARLMDAIPALRREIARRAGE